MSIIGGILQGILVDVAKEFLFKKRTNKESWGCAILILLFSFVVLIAFSLLINLGSKPLDEKILRSIKVGDSVFVKYDFGIDFYKKGDIKLYEWEQREIKYASEKKVGFMTVNTVNSKFFFKNETSFIGFYAGLDSLGGEQWLMIIPSNAVTHPPKPKDSYDFRARRWENKKYDRFNSTKLSNEFYVKSSDIVFINNDKIFK